MADETERVCEPGPDGKGPRNWRVRVEGLIRRAMTEKRQMSVLYRDEPVTGEPHRLGAKDGVPTLLLWQTGAAEPDGTGKWRTLRLTRVDAPCVEPWSFGKPGPESEPPDVGWDEETQKDAGGAREAAGPEEPVAGKTA